MGMAVDAIGVSRLCAEKTKRRRRRRRRRHVTLGRCVAVCGWPWALGFVGQVTYLRDGATEQRQLQGSST
eukprot:COSAG01_NODE_20721_length_938_cov_1.675805_2_plen_69_part_01